MWAPVSDSFRLLDVATHVASGYAVSCIKNELQRNINCSSTEMKERSLHFEKGYI